MSIRSTEDGETIRCGLFHKGPGPLKRAIVFFNGRSEWIEKYEVLPELFELDSGTGFLTWDHRGQGGSGGMRSHIGSYDSFAGDAAAVIEQLIPGVPYDVMAHSMGGLIATYAAMTGKISPASFTLCSPLLRLPDSPIKRKVASPLVKILNRLDLGSYHSGVGASGRNRFHGNRLTHSYAGFQIVRNSPYPIPTPTFAWIGATFKACDYIFDPANLRSFKIRTLVLGGNEEAVVDQRAFSEWVQLAASLSSAEVMYEAIQGGKHELLNEVPAIREYVLNRIKMWFQVRHSP